MRARTTEVLVFLEGFTYTPPEDTVGHETISIRRIRNNGTPLFPDGLLQDRILPSCVMIPEWCTKDRQMLQIKIDQRRFDGTPVYLQGYKWVPREESYVVQVCEALGIVFGCSLSETPGYRYVHKSAWSICVPRNYSDQLLLIDADHRIRATVLDPCSHTPILRIHPRFTFTIGYTAQRHEIIARAYDCGRVYCSVRQLYASRESFHQMWISSQRTVLRIVEQTFPHWYDITKHWT